MIEQMRTSIVFLSVILTAATAAIAGMGKSVVEVQSVRLEVEQPGYENALQICIHDYWAANHDKTEVTCQIYYVNEEGKEWKVADFSLKRASGDRYSGAYQSGKDFVHGTVAKVVYKCDTLLQPISTWCMFTFH